MNMGLLIGIAVTGMFIYFVLRSGKKGNVRRVVQCNSDNAVRMSVEERILEKNADWLEARWEFARREQAIGAVSTVPKWFFDDATDRQIARLEDLGLGVDRRSPPTKGEASDLIGLFEQLDPEDEEVLKFFKVPRRAFNQSKGRHEVAQILADAGNVESWESRPASQMQKEFYRYFSVQTPKGLTHNAAQEYIREHRRSVEGRDEQKVDDWDIYESLFEEINDREFREDCELKKVSVSLFRSAIAELLSEGNTLSNLEDDPEIVVAKVKELKPSIVRT
jgi:hypothetical protein